MFPYDPSYLHIYEMKEDARESVTLVVESAPPIEYDVQAVRMFDEVEVNNFEKPTTMWQPSRSSMGVIAFLIGLLSSAGTGEFATGAVVKPIVPLTLFACESWAGILKRFMTFLAPLFRKNDIETSKLYRKFYSRNS